MFCIRVISNVQPGQVIEWCVSTEHPAVLLSGSKSINGVITTYTHSELANKCKRETKAANENLQFRLKANFTGSSKKPVNVVLKVDGQIERECTLSSGQQVNSTIAVR